MGRFCSVENVVVVGWAYSFPTFVDNSLKRVELTLTENNREN